MSSTKRVEIIERVRSLALGLIRIAAGSNKEHCGLIYTDKIIAILNVSPNPHAEFAMDTDAQAAAMKSEGWPLAVWHTHPGGKREPSMVDRNNVLPGAAQVISTPTWLGTWWEGELIQEVHMATSNDVGEIFEAGDGTWSWHVQAANGKVVDEGHGYNDKRSAAEALYRARPDLSPEEQAKTVAQGGPTSEADALGGAGGGTAGGTTGGTTSGYSDGGPGPTGPGTGVGGNSSGVGPTGPAGGGGGGNSYGIGPSTTGP